MIKNKIIYQEGDLINNMFYILELPPLSYHDGKRIRSRRRALFLCKCGNTIETLIESVKSGKTKSCSCLQYNPDHLPPPPIQKHGQAKKSGHSSEYRAWCAMKIRCKGETKEYNKLYKSKGIKVCDRWVNSFENFYEDMGPRPSKNHSLDRINGNLGYYKENCRWATTKEQNRNKSSNILITYNEKTQCVTDWALELGLSHSGFLYRINNYTDKEKIFMPKITSISSSRTIKRPINSINI